MSIKTSNIGVTLKNPVDETEVHALQNVSFGVEENRFVTFVGPSGCGKTSLLNVLAGLIKPTCGQVMIYGKPVAGPGPDRGHSEGFLRDSLGGQQYTTHARARLGGADPDGIGLSDVARD